MFVVWGHREGGDRVPGRGETQLRVGDQVRNNGGDRLVRHDDRSSRVRLGGHRRAGGDKVTPARRLLYW